MQMLSITGKFKNLEIPLKNSFKNQYVFCQVKLKNWHPFWHVDMPIPKIGLPMACWHIKLNNWHDFGTLASQFDPPSLFLKGEELTLPKNLKKGRDGKIAKGQGGFCRKGGDAVSQGIFSSWGVANVTAMTFNYFQVIVFLFPFHVSLSLCFNSTVLLPVYRVYTSCLHNTVVSSCYRLHTSCLHRTGVTCFSLNMWFQFILEMCHQSGVNERLQTYSLTYGQSIMVCF